MLETFVRGFFKQGALIVRLPNGKSVSIGGAQEADAPIIVRVHDGLTAMRIARNPSLAVGEAYMGGTLSFERGGIYDLLAVAVRNFRRRKRKGPFEALRRRLAHANARAAARRNVAHHYDLSDALYRLFLDEDRQYSCAYYPEPGLSLDEAQRAKKRHIAAKLLLSPGQRVLDIGSGWGGLALSLAEEQGAETLGVTLSEHQLEAARARAASRGLAAKAKFELKDFRDVEGAFDRIVSVGMFEHVGPPNFDAYFGAIARLLREDGVALVHTIGRLDGPGRTNPWVAKYIFPGGYIPALSDIAPAVERAGLVLADIEVLRIHYAETLKAWRERFKARWDDAARLYDERFCRMWEFYLASSEANFRFGDFAVFQLQLAKRLDAVPITRDYIAAFEHAHAHDGARVAAE
jgi:cyclopropane-fatty-acyl-phospholipid synthase